MNTNLIKSSLAKAILSAALYGSLVLPVFAVDGNEAQLLALVSKGETQAATELIGRRTDVNQTQTDGTSALQWAIYYNDPTLVKALLRRDAKIDVKNDYGATPFSQAAIQANPEIIKLLLDAGADANERGADDQTPLMIVARTPTVEAARLLIKAGADVNAVEKWRGQTALMWAAAQKQPQMLALLLASGADPDMQSIPNEWERQVTAEPRMKILPPGGMTALLYAAREGCTDCVAELIAAGADLNKPDPDGITPLVMAGLNAKWDSMKLLIEAGANVDKWDIYGRNPLYTVADYNTLPHGGRADRLSSDLTKPIEIAQMLVAAGANVNLQLKLFPPYRALGADRGADGELRTGSTALFRAARGGDLEMVKFLLDNNALVDLPNENGVTPLMIASAYHASDIDTRGRFLSEAEGIAIANLLIAAGADVNAQANTGQTAIYGAAAKGWTELVKVLAAAGSDLLHKDNNGASVIDAAMGRGGAFGRGAGGQAHVETAAVLEQLVAAAQ